MESITELNKFKTDLYKAALEAKCGKLPSSEASAMAKLANAYSKMDNGVVQRLRMKERAKK